MGTFSERNLTASHSASYFRSRLLVSKSVSSPVYYRMTLNRPASSVTAVSTRLFLGSLSDAEQLAKDNPHQIRTVISLCEKRAKQRAAGIRYLQFPVRDARPIAVAWLNAILISIEDGMARGRVLVHCGAGMSRAPTVVAALLDRIGFLDFDRALSYLEDLRPAVAPSKALVESIARELSH